MSTHAQNSASGAHGWMRCSDWESNPTGSKAADEGTAAHELAANCLTTGRDAISYRGERIAVGHQTFEVDVEMAEAVQIYVDYVRALPGELMVEQRLPLTPITGEPDAFGTSDAVVISDELVVGDLKFGANPSNKVRASEIDEDGVETPNPQLGIYGTAALLEYDYLGPFSRVRMVIIQPRLNHVSEFVMTPDKLLAWSETVKRADTVNPGGKQCQWCRKKATCPALAANVQDDVGAAFEVIPVMAAGTLINNTVTIAEDDQLSAKMQAVDLIEDWCKAVRAEVERRLFAGVEVPGYKLVEGRKGSRAWSDAEAAEQMLKSFRIKHDEMYEYKLISPTTAEKLAKSKIIGERQWPKLTGLITQSKGTPSVAPVSDKRPALVVTPTADEFQDETAEDLV